MLRREYLKQYGFPDMLAVIRNGRIPPAATEARLDGQLVVLTGATSGVGLAVARRLHTYGADLLLLNRTPAKSRAVVEELTGEPGGSVDFFTVDFSDMGQTAAAARHLLDLHRPVDVLINNAGVHMTTRQLTVDGLELVFAVNHLSPFLLTRALLPSMVQRGRGRVIQVNSQGHRFFGLNLSDLDWARRRYVGLLGYGAAKTAQLLCSWEFADQLQGTGVTLVAMHPGAVRSNVGMNNGRLYRWFKHIFVDPGLDDASSSGIALHTLATQPLEHGRYYNLTHLEKPAPHALDRELGRQVWERSHALADRFLLP